MQAVLVTGGAGYIGSHIVRRLLEDGRRVVVIDDLSEGHAAAVGDADLVQARCGDREVLREVLGAGGIGCVVHMAASCAVGESMQDPAKYYENNVEQSLALLDECRKHAVGGIVFSSTAAVYGEPHAVPITEDHPQLPTNPYGETKHLFERALEWYRRAYGTRWIALRYFNAAGAHPDGTLGEDHDPEAHLVPRLLKAVIDGGPPTPIFGEDYPTSDGTCVRDYVHVVDLAEAHLLAMRALEHGGVEGQAFNLGNGGGFSVREVVETVARVTGSPPPTAAAPRRAGDPAILVASSEAARQRLGWSPGFPELEGIVRTAWEWHRDRPRGYDDRAGRHARRSEAGR
jgi:UDP-glucose 4-epimerase